MQGIPSRQTDDAKGIVLAKLTPKDIQDFYTFFAGGTKSEPKALRALLLQGLCGLYPDRSHGGADDPELCVQSLSRPAT